jgi:lysophospholipase
LSDNEKAWRDLHAKQIIPELQSYLTLANISGFDVQQYINQINATNLPIVGLSVSGGGTQSGLGGLGIWQAYDARNPGAIASRTGGLSQILSYMTGLSGGGAITVAIM